MVNMHAGQLAVSPGMVRELENDQFPGWRHLAVTALASPGTVNAIFRIGDQLAARFPLRPGDAAAARRQLESEAAAARELAGRTRFATPEPVAIAVCRLAQGRLTGGPTSRPFARQRAAMVW
jgi:aminoglycoside phosphotransferase (APT) family kinase protein